MITTTELYKLQLYAHEQLYIIIHYILSIKTEDANSVQGRTDQLGELKSSRIETLLS